MGPPQTCLLGMDSDVSTGDTLNSVERHFKTSSFICKLPRSPFSPPSPAHRPLCLNISDLATFPFAPGGLGSASSHNLTQSKPEALN